MSLLIIEAALKTSLVLAAAASANALLYRRTSAAARHLVWTLAVVGLLLLPVLTAALPSWDIDVVPAKAPDAAPINGLTGPQEVAGPPAASRVAAPMVATAVAATGQAPIAGDLAWATGLSAMYAAGVLLLVIRLGAERWTVRRLARRATVMSDPEWTRLLTECASRMGVRVPVRLLRSLERTMPMAFGIRQPAILIPSVAGTWSEDRRRAVLLHELAHVARHDCLTQLMAAVACVAYWIHPGVWSVARRLRVERELACDDLVLGAGTDVRAYAGHLLELAYTLGGDRAPALAVSMARPRQLEGRLLAVLDAARNRTAPPLRNRLAGLAVTVALIVPLAAVEARLVPAKFATDQKPVVESRGVPAATAQPGLPGTWEIRPAETARVVHLRLSENGDSSYGSTIPIERLEGLTPAMRSGAGGSVRFSIRHDAGDFTFEGTFRSDVGAGTYTFTPSASFPADLAKRGFERPTPADQYMLARGDIGFAFLDELTRQGYARSNLSQLVRAAQHGATLDSLRELGALGYRLGRVETLITQMDHGVSPRYIRALRAQGLAGLTADDLVRARDHGVSAEYIRDLTALGYQRLSLDALIGARDHGISPEYVRDLRELGYQLTLAELTKARDHGVSPEYIRELTALGYEHQSLDSLVRLRDQGAPQYLPRHLKAMSVGAMLRTLVERWTK
jgi:beta-lactamase regulating signal transducer with metallopeptidase domain